MTSIRARLGLQGGMVPDDIDAAVDDQIARIGPSGDCPLDARDCLRDARAGLFVPREREPRTGRSAADYR